MEMFVCWIQYLMSSSGCFDWKHGTRILQRRYPIRVKQFLLSYHQEKDIIPGDVVVYNLRTQPIPIVHRVLTVQERYL
jgi:hypothetical protein